MPDSLLQAWSDKAWRIFISLKLTFVLLTLIGIGATIGMSFDQTVTYEEFYKTRSESGFLVWVLSFFELYDTFHSWWFSLAILLLALNLIACSIERLPRIYFDAVRPRPYLTDRRLLGLNLTHHVIVPDQEKAVALINTFHERLAKASKSAALQDYFFLDTQWMGRFGVYIVHIALLIIMFSSIYATQNGVDGHVMIEEGKKTRFITAKGAGGVNYTHDLGFYIGCDDFRLRTFVDNSPMEYESDLFIEDKQSKEAQKTVRVNEPLSYQGYTFYQSSFKPVISENIVELEVIEGTTRERRRVKLGEEWKLQDGTIIVAEKLYDDFAGIGQALRIAKKTGSATTYFHIFRRYKDFDAQVRADTFAVIFTDVDQQYATGLSIGKVPGISIIFSGFLILLVGLYLCFFTSPTRYFARIDQVHDGCRVIVAAQGFRNLSSVKTDFERRIARLGKQHG